MKYAETVVYAHRKWTPRHVRMEKPAARVKHQKRMVIMKRGMKITRQSSKPNGTLVKLSEETRGREKMP